MFQKRSPTTKIIYGHGLSRGSARFTANSRRESRVSMSTPTSCGETEHYRTWDAVLRCTKDETIQAANIIGQTSFDWISI